jgi:hypothetical protein
MKADGVRGSPCEIRRRQWATLAQALFDRARRTMLGDDGNLMQVDGKFYPQISQMPQMREKKSVKSA